MCYLVEFQWLVAFTILHFHWLFNCPSWPARLRAPANPTAFNSKISNGNRIEWSPIRFCNHTSGRRQEVLLPMNHNLNKIYDT